MSKIPNKSYIYGPGNPQPPLEQYLQLEAQKTSKMLNNVLPRFNDEAIARFERNEISEDKFFLGLPRILDLCTRKLPADPLLVSMFELPRNTQAVFRSLLNSKYFE